MVDSANVYIANSTVCDGFGAFAKNDFLKDTIIEIGIATVLTNCNGHENPHLFTWSDDLPNNTWASTSGCAAFYNQSNTPNVKMIRNFASNTFQFITLRDIKQNEELFHTYKSIKWRKCFAPIKNL